VDYILTHAGPDTLVRMAGLESDYLDPTTSFLEYIATSTVYEKWFCGHMHLDKDIGKFSILWDRILQIF